MRIGFFYRDYGKPGGMPRETRYLAEALARRGHGVFVYFYDDQPSDQKVAGVEARAYRRPPKPLSTDKDLHTLLRSNGDELEVLFMIGGHVPENFGVSRASKEGRIPYIISIGEAYNPFNLARRTARKKIWKLFEASVLRNALAIRCYSHENVRQLEAYLPNLESFILREGIHPFDLPEEEGVPYDRRFTNLLFLGRVSVAKKGIDQLIKAVATLSPRHPELRLHIVGPIENHDRSRFRDLCKSVPDEVLHYHEPIYDARKYAYLAGADLFVHPSRHEGIPRSIREAMGVGTPLVVTPETNVAEDIERYEAGFVVKCEAESIAAAIEAFIEHPDRNRLRDNALRMARELYDWDVIASELDKQLGRWKIEGLLGREGPKTRGL